MEPAPSELLAWSDATVTFSRDDHPTHVPHPSKYALLVDPIVGGFCLPRVLMDGGSGLNTIFPNTLAKMGIFPSNL